MKKIISLVLALVMAFSLCGCNMSDYKKAQNAYENGDYENASTMFETLGDYKESQAFYNKSQAAIYDEKIKAFVNDWTGNISDAEALYTDYKNLSDEIKAEMSYCEDFERTFPVYLVDYVSTLKNAEIEEIKRIIREYSECMSDDQLTDCMIVCGRWASVEFVEDFLKDRLKNPHSYNRYSGTVTVPVEYRESSCCTVDLEFEYGAKNSFGAEVESTDTVYVCFSYDLETRNVQYDYIGLDKSKRDKTVQALTAPQKAESKAESSDIGHPVTVDEYLTNFWANIEEMRATSEDSEDYREWGEALTIPAKEDFKNSGNGTWRGSATVKSLTYFLTLHTETDDIDSRLLGVGIQIPSNAIDETTRIYAVLSLSIMTITSYDKTYTNDDATRLMTQLMDEGRPLRSNGVRWRYDNVKYDDNYNTFAYFYGELISDSEDNSPAASAPESTSSGNPSPTPTTAPVTTGENNALRAAKDYLNITAFSYTGLINQLKYDGYSDSEAKYGADNCGANWKGQAARAAKQYLDITSFSRSSLIDQLIYEGYTQEEAEYGVTQVGY